MFAVVVAALLAHAVGLHVLLWGGSLRRRSTVIGAVVLAGLVLLASLNLELGLVDQKFASTFAFDWFTGASSSRPNATFVVQGLVNAPAFALTGVWWAAIGTNAALVALTFTWLHGRDAALGWWFLSPAVVNFALFALRDPLIGLLLLVVAVDLVRRPRGLPGAWAWFALVSLALTRPEVAVVVVGAKVVVVLWSARRPHQRTLLVPVAAVGLLGLLVVAPATLTQGEVAGPSDAVEELDSVFVARATRYTDVDGGGSNILDGRLPSLPVPVRLATQATAFVVLPLPIDLDTPGLALAMVDSAWLALFAWRFRRRLPAPGIILAGSLAVSTALFASNYGNLFRLRMPLYFILAGAVAATIDATGKAHRELEGDGLAARQAGGRAPVRHRALVDG